MEQEACTFESDKASETEPFDKQPLRLDFDDLATIGRQSFMDFSEPIVGRIRELARIFVAMKSRHSAQSTNLPAVNDFNDVDAPFKIPKRRGRPRKATHQKDTKLVADWIQARTSGVCKKDFTKQAGVTLKYLDKVLNRFSKKKSRLDKKVSQGHN